MRTATLGALAMAASLAPAVACAWTVRLSAPVAAMVADAAGDVLVADQVTRRRTTASDIVKLDRRTGARAWRHRMRAAGRQERVALVGVLAPIAGTDVVVGGEVRSTAESGALVARLAGRDGTERWRRLLRGGATAPAREAVTGAAVDAAGDVLVGGTLQGTDVPGDYGDLAVAKLRGGDGSDLWRFSLPGTQRADVLAVDARGDAIAAGFRSGAPLYPAPQPAAVVVHGRQPAGSRDTLGERGEQADPDRQRQSEHPRRRADQRGEHRHQRDCHQRAGVALAQVIVALEVQWSRWLARWRASELGPA